MLGWLWAWKIIEFWEIKFDAFKMKMKEIILFYFFCVSGNIKGFVCFATIVKFSLIRGSGEFLLYKKMCINSVIFLMRKLFYRNYSG